MTKITLREDCGNSPKNVFAQNLTVAFGIGDTEFILRSVTDTVCWTIAGATVLHGKAALLAELARAQVDPTVELVIGHVMSHGKAGAVNGTVQQESGKIHAFCYVYEFSSAKGTSVAAITSYVIALKRGDYDPS